MTIGAANEAGSAAGAARDWQAVREVGDIQFAPLPTMPPPPPAQVPEWLKALGRAAEAIFAPVGRLLGMSWPVFQWLLIVVGTALMLFAIWRLVLVPAVDAWRSRRAHDPAEEDWLPDNAAAIALLEDADRLAREGHFDEATHLLLQRSVRQIAEARPGVISSSSTAREISALSALPEAGRGAFAVIADRVERAWFALRELDEADWAAARAAYAQFARIELRT